MLKNLKWQKLFMILRKHILTQVGSFGPLFTLKIYFLLKQNIIVKSVWFNGAIAALSTS